MDRKQIEREKVRRLVKWIRGKRAAPVRIDLEPTSSCNLKCRFCWTRSAERFSSRQYENLLSEKRILEIVEEAVDMGVVEWQIAGGWEPLIKPDSMARMAEIIKENGMYGCITTNGTLFSNSLIKRLVEIGWDEILFSLEGPNAVIHDYVTQVPGSFEKATQAMKTFGHWKKKFKAIKPSYSFHAVLTNRNYDKLSEMIKLGFGLGCTGVNFEPISIWSEEGSKLKLNEKQSREVRKHAKEALRIADKLNVQTNAKNILEPKLVEKSEMDRILKKDAKRFGKGKIISSPCFEPWLGLEVRISGRVAPCRLCDDDAGCERIHNQSLKEVWYGKFFQVFREDMMNWRMPNYCYTCAAGNVVNIRDMRKKIVEKLKS